MFSGIDLAGLHVVVGLGKSGLSMVRALHALGARLRVVDSRAEPPALTECRRIAPDIDYRLGGFDPQDFAAADRILLSPGIALATPVIAAAAARGVPIWGDIELFARLNRTPVAAITGSNGKSTVTTLLGAMAQQAGMRVAVGGNLGTPALDLLFQDDMQPELFILELSSFQLETTNSLHPVVATVLNISPDHMDRYHDLADYASAKRRIFRGDGYMVLNADDPMVVAMQEPQRQIVWFTVKEPGVGEFGLRKLDGREYLAYGSEGLLATAELVIRGRHNQANALAALAMGQVLGLSRVAMLTALRDFQGLAHRCQLILERDGVRWYNDSKGTNVGATLAALQGMPEPVVLIAGGDGKGQDFSPLRDAMQAHGRAAVLLGRDAMQIAAVLTDVVSVQQAADMQQAVRLAAELAQPGDTVLLSPACASLDMFRNYQERGEVYAAAVRERYP